MTKQDSAIEYTMAEQDFLYAIDFIGQQYKKMKKYITPQIKDKVEAKLDEWFHENVMEVVEPLYLE